MTAGDSVLARSCQAGRTTCGGTDHGAGRGGGESPEVTAATDRFAEQDRSGGEGGHQTELWKDNPRGGAAWERSGAGAGGPSQSE